MYFKWIVLTAYWRAGSLHKTGLGRLHQKEPAVCKVEGQAGRIEQSEYLKRTEMLLSPAWCSGRRLLRFMAVKVFKGFQFFNKRLVLVLQDSHSVLQTFNILLLLPATFACCLSVGGITNNLSVLFILVVVGACSAGCYDVSWDMLGWVFGNLWNNSKDMHDWDKNTQTHFLLFSYLFFMRRTSRLRVTSSVAPWTGRAGEEAMTTPGAMVLAGAARIW